MITIYSDKQKFESIQAIIDSEERLGELLEIKDISLKMNNLCFNEIVVQKYGFDLSLDWQNVLAPYLFPKNISLTKDNLLAFVYFLLGNFEKCYQLLANNPSLLQEVEYYMRISNGVETSEKDLSIDTLNEYDDYRLMHNAAISLYYTSSNLDFEKISYFFKEAMQLAPDDVYDAFTSKYYLSFLMDFDYFDQAEVLLESKLKLAGSSPFAIIELKALQNKIGLRNLVVPYDKTLMEKLKNQLWEVLQAYEAQNRMLEVGLVLEDASFVANISESFTESLGYITRAIDIFKNEELKEFFYQAEWKKGNLLYTWAKKGQAQFFNAAIQSYKTALQYFSKMAYPEVYAEIQHYLGVIYSEIPCEPEKKGIWAAFSVSAFQEALEIFKKERFPYDYASVCNSFANALILYPEAKKTDNIEKAFYNYREALEIRTAENYPMERVLTLLNYIECCWHANASEKHHNAIRLQDMISKANQVLRLNDSPDIVNQANEHLARIEDLKTILE